MPINVELINDNRVVLQTYQDPIDAAQMNALRVKMDQEILPSALGKLIIIADFSGVQNLPNTILSSGAGMLRGAHPNTGMIICVTPGSFVNSMAGVLSSLTARNHLKIVRSLDQAYVEVNQLLLKEA